MSWNNGLKRKKFEARMAKQEKEYRKAGMTAEQIKAMYEFDLDQFNSDRRFYMHTQPLEEHEFDEEGDESDNALMKQFLDAYSVSDEDNYFALSDRYGWIDAIENPSLIETIKELSTDDIEIITLLVYEGYKLAEVAEIMGMTYNQIWYRFDKLKTKLSEVFSEKF